MAKVMVLLYKSKYLRLGALCAAPAQGGSRPPLSLRASIRADVSFFGVYREGEGMHYGRTIAMTGRGFG